MAIPARIQLTKDVYMKVDGQWSIYLSGSVIDVTDPSVIHPSHGTVLTEAVGTLKGGGHTAVRSIRTR